MNFRSTVAERAIEAVNRLLDAAMTTAWTSTLSHQHMWPPSDEEWVADDASSAQENSSAPNQTGKQH